MRTMLKEFARDERGATAIEYGLVVSLIGIAASMALTELGQTISGMFEQITRALDTVASKMR
jgi:pilus assembly protein Flp/PilA